MQCVVRFPAKWVSASLFEAALRGSCGPHAPDSHDIVFEIPADCKIMIDSAIRLLSLANQLVSTTRRTRLRFEEGETGTMGYLNRMGFFDCLDPRVGIEPERPFISRAALHRGGNRMLVEITRINRGVRDDELPTRLSDAVKEACTSRVDVEDLGGAVWTIFAELIQNIFDHSDTQLDGYAALQVYPGGNKVSVAVSDCGRGIMDTLRPALRTEFPKLANLSDTEVLVEIFRQGVSRHGADRGCGLKGCAAKAIKFAASLDVRLPNQRVLLVPTNGIYKLNTAHCYERLPLLWGTHIGFNFGMGA